MLEHADGVATTVLCGLIMRKPISAVRLIMRRLNLLRRCSKTLLWTDRNVQMCISTHVVTRRIPVYVRECHLHGRLKQIGSVVVFENGERYCVLWFADVRNPAVCASGPACGWRTLNF